MEWNDIACRRQPEGQRRRAMAIQRAADAPEREGAAQEKVRRALGAGGDFLRGTGGELRGGMVLHVEEMGSDPLLIGIQLAERAARDTDETRLSSVRFSRAP